MPLVNQRIDVPVTIDESKCIKGCRLCVDMCPLDSLAIDPEAGAATLRRLAVDAEAWVRAAALEAVPAIGVGGLLDLVIAAVDDPSWEVRKGAARALSAVPEDVALPPLVELADDTNLDVRKVAVQSLASWADSMTGRRALDRATEDSDADVRAYARAALH